MEDERNYFEESPLKRSKFDPNSPNINTSPSSNHNFNNGWCNKNVEPPENFEVRPLSSEGTSTNMSMTDDCSLGKEPRSKFESDEPAQKSSNAYVEVPVLSDEAEKAGDSDNLSEMSDLSGFSEEAWRPLAGPMSWVQQQMSLGKDPRVVLQELIPTYTHIPDDIDDLTLWKIVINLLSEPEPRKKLKSVNTLDDVVALMKKSSNIIVLTGAGVSVSCGIPDFRSRDGIYARLAVDFPDLPDPQAMFDIHYFSKDPRPFFKFAKEIYPGQFEPSRSHKFIKLIEEQGKLLRNYTQNIDTLEQVAGITKIIQCHGSFATATCMSCKHKVDSEAVRDDILNQVIPQCPKCNSNTNSTGENLSVMKPDIVFFGESLPEKFHKQMAEDKDKCDLLIVIGSSLKVRPVALIPNSLPPDIPQILINREPLRHLQFDVEFLGDCDIIINELCRRLGDEWDKFCDRPELVEVDRYSIDTPPHYTMDNNSQDSDVHESGLEPKIDTSRHLFQQADFNQTQQCNSLKSLQTDFESSQATKQVESVDHTDVLSNSENCVDTFVEECLDNDERNCVGASKLNNSGLQNSLNDIQSERNGNECELEAKNKKEIICVFQKKESLAQRLQENQFLFLPPCRYVFRGAEIYSDLDSDIDTSSSSSDSSMEREDHSSSVDQSDMRYQSETRSPSET